MPVSRRIRLGIPPFEIAERQAEHLIQKAATQSGHGDVDFTFELVALKAPGEHLPGLFTGPEEESAAHADLLQSTLSRGEVEVVLHHLGDRPGTLSLDDSMVVLERQEPLDVVLGLGPLHELAPGSIVAVSSLRLNSLVKAFRPDLQPIHLRGGPRTCLQKLEEGVVSTLLMPQSLLQWLGAELPVVQTLPPGEWIALPGMGTLVAQVRREQRRLLAWLQGLEHTPTRWSARVEAWVSRKLQGHRVHGVRAVWENGTLRVHAFVADPNREQLARHSQSFGSTPDATAWQHQSAEFASELLQKLAAAC